MAVDLGPMGLIKNTLVQGQVFELARAPALFFPVNVAQGAGPVDGGKAGVTGLAKRPIKSGVVSQHQLGAGQQTGDPGIVQALPLELVVAQAGDQAHLFRQRPPRVFEAVINRHHPHRQTTGQIDLQAQHRQLDDFVLPVVQAGGLGVKHQHPPGLA